MPQAKKSLAQLSVWLNQTLVGSMTELPNDQNLFIFDRDYAEDSNRPILSLSFMDAQNRLLVRPLEGGVRVPPFFSNLLPEDELRRYVAERAGVKAVRDFPLLQLLGEDLPGAVIVRPESEGPPPEELEPEEAAISTEEQVKRPLRFSLAGVQMKFSARGSPQRGLTIPAEGKGGHWILKLPSLRFPKVPENEHSMMVFARAVGIDTADTGLTAVEEVENLPERYRKQGGAALWVRRFDRTDQNMRIHMEDFNQLYSQFPERKYSNYSYGNMASDLAQIVGLPAVEEFLRRLVFSAAIGNMDMHLKNWSLLYRDGHTPQLSPAYDFVSTIAYLPDVDMALSVAKEKDVRRFDWELMNRFLAKLPVPSAPLLAVAQQMAEQIMYVWPRVRAELPMTDEAKEMVTERMHMFPLTAPYA